MSTEYDVIIIGGGPAGLTAGLYSCRAMMKTLLIEENAVGGQVLRTQRVENYPGFPEGVASTELIERMERQALNMGLEIVIEEVKEIISGTAGNTHIKSVRTDREERLSPGIIIASGAFPAKLGVPGEEEFTGRGISYCAVCDGRLFQDKDVLVVGGGNTAVEEALFLTRFARKVGIVHRRDRLRATGILRRKAKADDRIDFYWDRTVKEILGEKTVSAVRLKETGGTKEEMVSCQGVFIYVGTRPNSGFLGDLIEKDDAGYVVTDENMETSLEGMFACGDVRHKSLKQITVACGEGATAAVACRRYIEKIKNRGGRDG